MIFHVPNKDIQYLTLKIDNVIIEKVDEFNFLGSTMDTNLNWKKHSEKICNKSILLLLLHLFPLLCGVDVSCETPPSRPVLRVLI